MKELTLTEALDKAVNIIYEFWSYAHTPTERVEKPFSEWLTLFVEWYSDKYLKETTIEEDN